MNVVIDRLADVILKQLSPAGVEALSLSAFLKSQWKPYAEGYLEDFFKYAFNVDAGLINKDAVFGLWMRHTLSLDTDFIDKVVSSKDFDFYIERAFEIGVRSVGVVKKQETEEEILEQLVELTGAKLSNVKRTVKNWFEKTQGKYFDRFIKAETERLFFSAGETNDPNSLRSLGKKYKKFVEADGYWSSMGDFDANTSKVFGQVEALDRQGIKQYRIVANFGEGTCPICEHFDGSTWNVESAIGEVEDMILIGADKEPELFNPWPDRSIVDTYPDPEQSPFLLPPYHPHCNCDVVSL